MSISGIGSRNTYIYNSQTKRLSTKDGSKDAFVDYFNGELSEEECDFLNGFDARSKYGIKGMIETYSSSDEAQNPFNNPEKTEFEVSAEVFDAAETHFFIDGEHMVTEYDAYFFTLINQDELSKALAEKLLGKYKGTSVQEMSDREPGANEVTDAAQNTVTPEKNEEKRCRFGIPLWLENKALRQYEEWLYKPLSETKSEEAKKK